MPGSAQRKEAPSAASPSAYNARRTVGAKRGTMKSTATCVESGTANAVPQKITQTKATVASSSVHAAGAPNTKRPTPCTTRARKRTAKTPAPVRSAQRPRKPGTDHVFPENVVCPLLDRIDALEESARPLFRVLRLQIRVLHGLPERGHVGHRDLDALRAEELDELLFLAHAVFVVEFPRLRRRPFHLCPVCRGKRVPGLRGDRELQRVHEVPREHDLPRYLVELRRLQRRQRVVLAVDGPGLQAQVDLCEGERRRVRAERLPEEEPLLGARHAQLHPREIGRGSYRPRPGEAHLTSAEIDGLQQLDSHRLGDPAAHFPADRPPV